MAVPRLRAAKFDEQMTLVEHLDELRNRIIVSAAVLVVACGLCFWQNHLLLEIANKPLPDGIKPITFGVTEPFMSTLKISIYAGILISLPVILYQAYAFLLPAHPLVFSDHGISRLQWPRSGVSGKGTL